MASGANLWSVRATVPQGAVARVEESLTRALCGPEGVLEGPGDRILAVTANALGDDTTDGPHRLWRVDVLCATEPDAAALARAARELAAAGIGMKPRVRRVPDRDWSIPSRSSSEPVRAGRFFVRASAHDGPRPGGAVELIVNGGPAFGTGTHESTRGCLIAIDDLAKRERGVERPLDLGTGTGILAMAMCRVWNRRVLGVDVDPRAVDFARRVAGVNRLRHRVEFVVGDGCRHRRVSAGGPYDLIVANILAAPLIAMARDVGPRVSPGGRVILSGILTHQERRVFAAYRRNRVRLERRIELGGWTTLVLRRPPGGARPPAAHLRSIETSVGSNGSRAQAAISPSPSRTTRKTPASPRLPSPSSPDRNDPSENSGNVVMTNTTFPHKPGRPTGTGRYVGLHAPRYKRRNDFPHAPISRPGVAETAWRPPRPLDDPAGGPA